LWLWFGWPSSCLDPGRGRKIDNPPKEEGSEELPRYVRLTVLVVTVAALTGAIIWAQQPLEQGVGRESPAAGDSTAVGVVGVRDAVLDALAAGHSPESIVDMARAGTLVENYQPSLVGPEPLVSLVKRVLRDEVPGWPEPPTGEGAGGGGGGGDSVSGQGRRPKVTDAQLSHSADALMVAYNAEKYAEAASYMSRKRWNECGGRYGLADALEQNHMIERLDYELNEVNITSRKPDGTIDADVTFSSHDPSTGEQFEDHFAAGLSFEKDHQLGWVLLDVFPLGAGAFC
jgi:hypothetical protein